MTPASLAQRLQLRRSLLASLMLAQGVPLLLAGDEVGNSQRGNNNAYCQDNADRMGRLVRASARTALDLTDFVRRLIDLRRRFPQLRSRQWTDGRREDGSFGVLWLTPGATEMTEEDWNFPDGRFLAYVLGAVDRATARRFISRSMPRASRSRSTFPAIEGWHGWREELNTLSHAAGPAVGR